MAILAHDFRMTDYKNSNQLEPTKRLLLAFDNVANSNSLLLTATRKEGDLKSLFIAFIKSDTFKNVLCKAESDGGGSNWHEFNEEEECWGPQAGAFYNGNDIRFKRYLTPEYFEYKLRGMLNYGTCIYVGRLPKKEVLEIVNSFVAIQAPDHDEVLEVRNQFSIQFRLPRAIQREPTGERSYIL